MEKFYPKDFVLWRPQVLLLLLFLEIVFDCTGGGGVVVEAFIFGRKPSLGGYGDDCSAGSPCHQQFKCDALRNKCVCPKVHSRLTLFYHEKQDKCLSAVGKWCNLDLKKEDDDDLPKFECVPYSECVRPEKAGQNMPDIFGVCTCQSGFEEDETHVCRPAMMIQIGSGDSIVREAQAQKRIGMQEGQEGTLPVEEDMEKGPKLEGNEIMRDQDGKQNHHFKPMTPSKPPFGVDTKDDNDGLVISKIDIDNWVEYDPTKSANSGASIWKYNVQLNICVLIAVKLVLFLL